MLVQFSMTRNRHSKVQFHHTVNKYDWVNSWKSCIDLYTFAIFVRFSFRGKITQHFEFVSNGFSTSNGQPTYKWFHRRYASFQLPLIKENTGQWRLCRYISFRSVWEESRVPLLLRLFSFVTIISRWAAVNEMRKYSNTFCQYIECDIRNILNISISLIAS